MNDDAGPSEFVPPGFHETGFVIRHNACGQLLFPYIVDQRPRRIWIEAVFLLQPAKDVRIVQAVRYQAPQLPDADSHLGAPRRHGSVPPGNGRGGTGSLFHEQLILPKALDLPGRASEHEHVPDPKRIIHEFRLHGAHLLARALDDNVIFRPLGDGADTRIAGLLAAPTPREVAAGPIPQDQGQRRPGHLKWVIAGQHRQDPVIVRVRQLGKGLRPPEHVEQLSVLPVVSGDDADDLLSKNIEASSGDVHGIDFSLHHRPGDRRGLHQFVPLKNQYPTLARCVEQVAGSTDPLQSAGNGFGRLELVDQVHGADINAQLQRGRRDQGVQFTVLESILGLKPHLLGDRTVVHAYLRVLAVVKFRNPQGCTLGFVAAVHKNQCGIVTGHFLQEKLVGARPQCRIPGFQEIRQRRHDLDIQVFAHTGIHDRTGPLPAVVASAHQKSRDLLDRTEGRRTADSLHRLLYQLFQTLQADRQMHAALVVTHGVNLVDNHRPYGGQMRRHTLAAQKEIERFGGGDQNMGRLSDHLGAVASRRVPRPHGDTDLRQISGRFFPDSVQRLQQVLVDIVSERLERGNVEHVHAVRQLAMLRSTGQIVDRAQKGREGLSRSRGG